MQGIYGKIQNSSGISLFVVMKNCIFRFAPEFVDTITNTVRLCPEPKPTPSQGHQPKAIVGSQQGTDTAG